MKNRAASPAVTATRGMVSLGMSAPAMALSAGAALAIAPIRVVHTVPFAPGSADLDERHAPGVALAVRGAEELDRMARPGSPRQPHRFQVAGVAPSDVALAARRAVAVRDVSLGAGVAPERIVPLGPGPALAPAPAPPARGPDRAEIAPCPTAERRCPPR